jgi:DNA-binding response OmpR family regulator
VGRRQPGQQHSRLSVPEALGVRFVIATSTDDGLEQARRRTFDAIISDMGRGIDRTAGCKLLKELRKAGIQSPYIISLYSAPRLRRDR